MAVVRQRFCLAIAMLLLVACASASPPSAGFRAAERTPLAAATAWLEPPSPTAQAVVPLAVLVLTATTGFRHESIGDARRVLQSFGDGGSEMRVVETEDLDSLEPARISGFDVVMFALTSGNLPLTPSQKNGLGDFVRSGHGFVGVHSAADTLYDWDEYGRMVGAYFKEHPWTQEAAVVVEDPHHPSTMQLPPRSLWNEELYTFQANPRTNSHVLLRLDAASVGASGDFPLAWCHLFGKGRVYYNALGHFGATWQDPRFQAQLRGALLWAGGRQGNRDGDACSLFIHTGA